MAAGIELRASAAVAERLERIAATDEHLRAFLSLDLDGALVAAALAEERRRRGERDPVLGLPIAVKDAYWTADPLTTFGSRAAVSDVSRDGDARAVARLRAAGAVILGKTNCSELCIGGYVLRGVPRFRGRSGGMPGASSGGCAVAVAAGLVDASLATDTGGSVRTPAAYCGVVGFKPTYGRIPLDGAVALAPSLDHGGVLARDVGTALAVASAAGAVRWAGGFPARLIHVSSSEVSHPSVASALDRVAARRCSSGVVRRRAPRDLTAGWREAFSVLMPAEAAAARRDVIDDPRLGAGARTIFEAGRRTPRAAISSAQRERARLCQRIAAALGDDGVLVAPAVDGVAPATLPDRDSPGFWGEMAWHAPFNLTGGPSLSVPVPGSDPPVSLQLAASPGADALVAAAGLWLESLLAG